MPSQAVAAGVVAPRAQARTVRAFFFITAPADPGLLPRLIEPVAKLGAVPSRVHASRESGDGSELSVDLQARRRRAAGRRAGRVCAARRGRRAPGDGRHRDRGLRRSPASLASGRGPPQRLCLSRRTGGQARRPMAGGKDWGRRRAPDLGDFEELAAQAWARLPRAFRDLCGDVVVRVEDFATEEVLRELKLESPFDLMGLYQGVSFEKKSVMDLPRGARHGVPVPPPAPRLLGRGRGDAGPPRRPRSRARDRPSFRLVGRRHGAHRGLGRRLSDTPGRPTRATAAPQVAFPGWTRQGAGEGTDLTRAFRT